MILVYVHLKSVLVMAGNIKREKIKNNLQDEDEQEVNILINKQRSIQI